MQKTRKEIRKEKRQVKKLNRFNYHNKKTLKGNSMKADRNSKIKAVKESDDETFEDEEIESDGAEDFSDGAEDFIEDRETHEKTKHPSDKLEQHIAREKKIEQEYYDEIKKNRVEQLQQQNEEEDKVISRYEKLLKLNKRKRKNGSTSSSKFNDGLDYLLELCTEESIQKMYSAAKEVNNDMSESEDEEEVFAALKRAKESKKKPLKAENVPAHTNTNSSIKSQDDKLKRRAEKLKEVEKKYFGDDEDFFNNLEADSCDGSDSEIESGGDEIFDDDQESPDEIAGQSGKKKGNIDRKSLGNSDSENSALENENISDSNSDDSEMSGGEKDESENEEKTSEEEKETDENDKPDEWEDIYGRKRDRDGNLIKEDTRSKYVPPHLRTALASTDASDDPKRLEKLQNLRRQIKGYINRLAESNLHRITIDIENLYSSNARHDVNQTLTQIIMDSLISNVLAADRLVLEQTLLIATLHANIGSEIGAFFLQVVVEKFDAIFRSVDSMSVENKELDNLIFIICHLYTYRLFKHNLIFELLHKLCDKMTEKRVECMLLVLRSVGFILRKDDPLMLKEFIIKVQKLAHSAGDENSKNTRVMFMLDILTAVKNNNVSKIPQFDPLLVEHFRKLLKQFIRSGKYITTLAVTLEDLLSADERGKWWLVGSAWAGTSKKEEAKTLQSSNSVQDEQREKIFALAKKQRMNTDDKKNIFYILMTAEDYLDAYEKILSSVKDERTIIAVLVHCCLSEKTYNPYYSVIAQKFCDHNRKFLLAIQFTIWDKIKDIKSLSAKRTSNLARLLVSLIENGNLPLSVLKVIEFAKPDKPTFEFLRKVLVGLLLIEEEKFHQIFERIAPSLKLKTFKDQLRVFLKVFLINDNFKVSENQSQKLEERMRLADKFLMTKHF